MSQYEAGRRARPGGNQPIERTDHPSPLDVSCSCGAWYNAGGQRLRDDWCGNEARRHDDVDDLEGFERQQLAREDY